MKRCSICNQAAAAHNVAETFTRSGRVWAVKLAPCGAITTPDKVRNKVRSAKQNTHKSA